MRKINRNWPRIQNTEFRSPNNQKKFTLDAICLINKRSTVAGSNIKKEKKNIKLLTTAAKPCPHDVIM